MHGVDEAQLPQSMFPDAVQRHQVPSPCYTVFTARWRSHAPSAASDGRNPGKAVIAFRRDSGVLPMN
jgi:hypothetical protein